MNKRMIVFYAVGIALLCLCLFKAIERSEDSMDTGMFYATTFGQGPSDLILSLRGSPHIIHKVEVVSIDARDGTGHQLKASIDKTEETVGKDPPHVDFRIDSAGASGDVTIVAHVRYRGLAYKVEESYAPSEEGYWPVTDFPVVTKQ
jgi:hypothetical protein